MRSASATKVKRHSGGLPKRRCVSEHSSDANVDAANIIKGRISSSSLYEP